MVISKTRFFSVFIDMMRNNNCFMKKYYIKEFNAEERLKELYTMQKNPFSLDNKLDWYSF